MGTRWIGPEEPTIPQDLQQAVGGHPLFAATLFRRGIASPAQAQAFLDPDCYTPSSAQALPDLEKAVHRLEAAIQQRERILVWGDFDVDGQTATALLVSGLKTLGADVTYILPIRATESHGIALPRLKTLMGEGVDILLTCDTGVAEHDAVQLANAQGTCVIITDHHELPPTLPDAFAIINPNRLPAEHALASLPGVGVALKLMEALFAAFDRSQDTEPFLDLVALGIVADVALQQADTRYLLQRGLSVLRSTERLGLQLLAEQAGLNLDTLTEEDIGFGLAPRMNALGRLDDANPMVDFLTTSDRTEAAVLAARLEALNSRRKLEQTQILEAARVRLERDPSLLDHPVLVLDHPAWPGGIVGLVAGQLARELNRPVILLRTGAGLASGSARSIDGIHMTDIIARCADLLQGFGGHAGAAGLSLPVENLPALQNQLDRAFQALYGEALPEPTLYLDGELDWDEPTLALAEDLGRLGPFGAGNPPVMLVSRGLRIVQQAQLGRSGEHLRLVLEDTKGVRQEVLYWFAGNTPLPDFPIDLAYQLSVSTFRGERQVRLTWMGSQPTELPEIVIPQPAMAFLDCRAEKDPAATLAKLREGNPHLSIFAEGLSGKPEGCRTRLEISPSESLALWITPPSPAVLQTVLSKASPQRVYLFFLPGDVLTVQGLLQQLAGLVRFAIRTQRTTTLPELGAVLGVPEGLIAQGLTWLERKGMIITEEVREEILIREGDGSDRGEVKEVERVIESMLSEMDSCRRFLHQADVEHIAS